MAPKVAVLFFLAACYITTFDVSIAKPQTKLVEDFSLIQNGQNRTKRQLGFVVIAGVLTGVAINNAYKCSEETGCYRGYCWAWCGLSLSSGDWCYTTKTYSQSYQYVSCTYDSECNACWKCAGPCSL